MRTRRFLRGQVGLNAAEHGGRTANQALRLRGDRAHRATEQDRYLAESRYASPPGSGSI